MQVIFAVRDLARSLDDTSRRRRLAWSPAGGRALSALRGVPGASWPLVRRSDGNVLAVAQAAATRP